MWGFYEGLDFIRHKYATQ